MKENEIGQSETAEEIADLPKKFAIDSDERANWLLRKLANIEAEKRRVMGQAAAIVKSLDAEDESLRSRFLPELEDYSRANLERGTKRRRFLQATVAFRTVPGGLRLTDEQAAAQWASDNLPDCFVTQTRFSQTAYREAAEKTLSESGELLPGAEIVPERESFSIRYPKDGATEE